MTIAGVASEMVWKVYSRDKHSASAQGGVHVIQTRQGGDLLGTMATLAAAVIVTKSYVNLVHSRHCYHTPSKFGALLLG